MEFVYGTVLVVAAIVTLGIARYAVTRFERSFWVRRFAATATMALIITALAAFGIALLCAGLVSDRSGWGLIELGASLGIIALAIGGVVWFFRRRRMVTVPAAPAGKSPAML